LQRTPETNGIVAVIREPALPKAGWMILRHQCWIAMPLQRGSAEDFDLTCLPQVWVRLADLSTQPAAGG
jgi:hypothetical protein